MRLGGVVAAILLGVAAPVAARAQAAPPSILKEDCSVLKGKAKKQCEVRNKAGDDAAAAAAKPAGANSDAPVGADADAPGEPPSGKPSTQSGGAKAKPDTSDMPTGTDADPPTSSMGPLKPDGTPNTAGPGGAPASSSSSPGSSSSSGGAVDEDDAPPTTAGGDTPVKAATLKDLGSHGDVSAAKAELEKNRVADDVKVGRFYLRDGNFAGAEARFKDAIQRDPGDPEPHFAMAELLVKQKRNPDAVLELRRYLELAPDDDHTKDAQKMLEKLGKEMSRR